jgi:ATP-dependent protease ClpP protease subunit
MTVVAMLFAGAAHAATITQETHTGKDGKVFRDISITGEIKYEDMDKFDRMLEIMTRAGTSDLMVRLESPGGNLIAGLHIANAIHNSGLLTWVAEKTQCTSICAVIWLSGTRRWATNTSLLGFHSPVLDGQESGAGGALLGAAYQRWGLSSDLIVYLTTPAPDQVIFLTEESARKYNLTYEGELPTEGFIQLLLQEFAKNNQQQEAKREEPPPQQQQQQVYETRLAYNLNLRAAPDPYSANILYYVWPNYIPQNTVVTFHDNFASCTKTAYGDVWCQISITVSGQAFTGWVNAYYLTLTDGRRVQCLWQGANGCNQQQGDYRRNG